MIAAWIVYALVVGTLVGCGAMALEKLLRAHRLPTRWVWVGAMLLSVFWPLRRVLWRPAPPPEVSSPLPDPAWVVALEPLTVQVGPESALRAFDEPLVLAWALASALLLAFAGLFLVRAHRLRKDWVGAETGGRSVLLSEEWGPAVVGFLRPQIVLPRWCRELEEDDLLLILDHEAEHLRAGDLRLLLAAGALPILFPWSLPAWWQLARLGIAVEGDCDLRVLRKHPGRKRSYLELLLEVGGRVPRRQAAAAMLSEPGETLERRIRIMTMPTPKHPWKRGFVLAGTGVALVALACSAPSPDVVEDIEAAFGMELPPEPSSSSEPVQNISAAPTFTPHTERPEIQNAAEVVKILEAEYPSDLKLQGVGGTTLVWVFVDERGKVQKAQVDRSSGHESLDRVALQVVGRAEFSPALNGGEAVPVWISVPVVFKTDGPGAAVFGVKAEGGVAEITGQRAREAEVSKPQRAPPAGYDAASIADAPTFTPYTVRPDITNRTEVARSLEEAYPRELRDEGIGGTANIWVFIDETGSVQRTVLDETSGHDLLDEAALEVAEILEFTPALNRDKPVPVWISLPITFTTR